tara:strand:- start:487 stop:798 length:312 start_codon:yes stop_codon:yes gene_type:complete
MQTVQLLKLISGEEVLGRVSQDRSGTYTIAMPVVIIQDQNNMGFEPFMPYADSESFDIASDKVIFTCKPTSALESHYIAATTPQEAPSIIDTSAAPSQSGIIV